MPGQFGPTSRVLFWVLRMSVMRTISDHCMSASRFIVCMDLNKPCCGIPSVILPAIRFQI